MRKEHQVPMIAAIRPQRRREDVRSIKTIDNKKPIIKFELVENVVMTDMGLMKRCEVCGRIQPLRMFPKSDMRAWTHGDICESCKRGDVMIG